MADSKNRKWVIAGVAAILLVIVIVAVIFVARKNLPFDDSVKGITITQEDKQGETSVTDVKAFIDKLQTDKWTKASGYDQKQAPICNIHLEPSGKQVEVLGSDANNAYACYDGTYYKIPKDAYDMVVGLIK